MALPATMKVLGLVLGVSLIIFMAFLAEASIEMLLRFSRAGKCASYGGLMGDAFGKTGRIMLQVAVLINNVGVLIVYMIIIGTISFHYLSCVMCMLIYCYISVLLLPAYMFL
jgi:sodium-coupled neutral amino acid transporter 2